MRKISYKDFVDKIHGGWFGKCLGGAAGAPVEGVKRMIDVNDFTEIYNPNLPNDDLDLQIMWLTLLEQKGPMFTQEDMADLWIEKCWYPFFEYGYFRKNYEMGIKPPYTGVINNSFFKESMGSPIRSELWGFISIGNPELAAYYAKMDATLDHADNSVYAEQFLAVIECMAFFEDDVRKLFDLGLSCIPDGCRLRRCIEDMLACHQDNPSDWSEAMELIRRKYSHPDFTNAVQNLGIIAIALLYGGKDLKRTINIALRCGYDADCTCATAASVIGILHGYEAFPEELKGLIDDWFVLGIDISRESCSIRHLALDTANVALHVPNPAVLFFDVPAECNYQYQKETMQLHPPEQITAQGLEKAMKQIPPIAWEVYGPYFEQLKKEETSGFSPHEEGCHLPSIECMVNNAVFLKKEYIPEQPFDFTVLPSSGTILSYEDLIPVEDEVTAQGQMCCYLRTFITAKEALRVWAIIGNNDGFSLWINGEKLLEADEIRYWTPLNNYRLVNLKAGKNEIVLKLLRRSDQLKFSFAFRVFNGTHWHRSPWHTDLR